MNAQELFDVAAASLAGVAFISGGQQDANVEATQWVLLRRANWSRATRRGRQTAAMERTGT